MNQKEVVDTLLDQAKIEPDFTSLGNYLFLLDSENHMLIMSL